MDCGRPGCCGVIKIKPPENCSCHISAPCSECESGAVYCPVCEWVSTD